MPQRRSSLLKRKCVAHTNWHNACCCHYLRGSDQEYWLPRASGQIQTWPSLLLSHIRRELHCQHCDLFLCLRRPGCFDSINCIYESTNVVLGQEYHSSLRLFRHHFFLYIENVNELLLFQDSRQWLRTKDCKHPQQLDLKVKDGNILQKINKPAKKDLLFLKHRAQA